MLEGWEDCPGKTTIERDMFWVVTWRRLWIYSLWSKVEWVSRRSGPKIQINVQRKENSQLLTKCKYVLRIWQKIKARPMCTHFELLFFMNCQILTFFLNMLNKNILKKPWQASNTIGVVQIQPFILCKV